MTRAHTHALQRLSASIIWIAHAADTEATLPTPTSIANLAFVGNQQSTVVANLTQIPVASATLGIAANTPVAFGADSLTLSNRSLPAPTLFMMTAEGRKFGTIGSSVIDPTYSVSTTGLALSLAVDTFGCWQFPLTLEKIPDAT